MSIKINGMDEVKIDELHELLKPEQGEVNIEGAIWYLANRLYQAQVKIEQLQKTMNQNNKSE